MPRFLHAHATHPSWVMAAALVLAQLRAQLNARVLADAQRGPSAALGASPPLGLLYITDHFAPNAQPLLDHLMAELPEVTDWAGCVGVGIAASGVEYFDEPALAVMLLDVPPDQYRVFSGVAPLPVGGSAGGFETATALVHADAGTPDVASLVSELAQRTRTGYVFGGLASGRGSMVQFAHSSHGALGGQGATTGVFQGGLSGVAFGPEVALVSRVTQGCTPVGPQRAVTRADGNVALALDGDDALGVLLDELSISLDEPQAAIDRLRATLVGISPDPAYPGLLSPASLAHADAWAQRTGWLGTEVRVRHIIGLDPVRRGVAVADHLAEGERLTFCERNPDAARADLLRMCAELRDELESPSGGKPQSMLGAVYVSCAGRGGPHFGSPSAELQLVRRALGDVPLVGFFAGGEIAHQQLYGYTGVLTVFVADVSPDAPAAPA
jgi:small ligand-binding sensory domain FIST